MFKNTYKKRKFFFAHEASCMIKMTTANSINEIAMTWLYLSLIRDIQVCKILTFGEEIDLTVGNYS